MGALRNWRRRVSGGPAGARGAIDRFDGRRLDGWAVDPADPGTPLAVALLVDGVRVAEGVADGPRPDLASAGLGRGRGGLSLALEPAVVGRAPVRLELVAAATGEPIRGAAREFELDAPVTLAIERLGLAGIAGRVTGGEAALAGDETVVIDVDGEFAASGPLARGPDGLGFSIYLPSSLYDGRAHVFEASVAGPASACRPVADILPAIQTPPDELLDSSRERGYAGLSALAALRYDALRERLREAADRSDAGALAANATRAHDLLVQGHAAPAGPVRLALPDTDAPRVSIVVPVHGGAALTRHCLASIALAAGDAAFEVVLVDDASPDWTAELAAGVEGLVTVTNETNVGFLHSCRRGAERARGEYLVFLNNDTEVTTGWLEELLDVFEREPGVGAVGAKLVYPDGRLQDAGGLVWESGTPWNVGHGDNPWAPEYNYLRDVDYLTGAALMVSRAAWDEVGGFDPGYAPAYYEDTDLAFRLRAAGHRTVYCPHACVIHYEGGSHGTDVERGVKRHQVVNAARFVKTWQHAFDGLGEEGVRPDLAKDRRRAFRVLVIDHEFPRVGQDAGSYAAVQEMRLLIALGAKVTFVPHNFRHVGAPVEALQKLGIECVHAPFDTSVEVFLQRRGRGVRPGVHHPLRRRRARAAARPEAHRRPGRVQQRGPALPARDAPRDRATDRRTSAARGDLPRRATASSPSWSRSTRSCPTTRPSTRSSPRT